MIPAGISGDVLTVSETNPLVPAPDRLPEMG